MKKPTIIGLLTFSALIVASAMTRDANAVTMTPQVGRWLTLPYTKYMDPVLRDAYLDKAASAGATGVLTVAPWDHLEYAGNDQYTWGFMDDFMAAAESRNLKVSMQISAAPPWISENDVWKPPRGDTQMAYWRDFIHDLVARYGTRVQRYEMWNEPNLGDFWHGENGPNPTDYAAMLRVGYLGAKEANSNVTVTFGGLSENDVGFLNATYDALRTYSDAATNHDFFDEMGVHPYAHQGSTPLPPSAGPPHGDWHSTWGYRNTSFLGIDKIKEALDAHGDSNKKLWIGEFGYNTSTAWQDPITDSLRAQYLKDAYSLVDARASYVSGLSWYTYYDDSSRGFNIVEPTTLAESHTFQAFREVALRQIAPSPRDRQVAPSPRDKCANKGGGKKKCKCRRRR